LQQPAVAVRIAEEAYVEEEAVGSRNKTPTSRWNTSLTLTQRLLMSSRRVDVGDDQLQTLSGAGLGHRK
jgi:hypothetical protein